MEIVLLILGFVLSFVFATLTLWFCSKTVDTQSADLKTAAIYNGIMTALTLLFLGVVLLAAETGFGFLILISLILMVVASIWLLTRLYNISIFSALWLTIAVWAVDQAVEWLLGALFG